jgi:hypothetical protein
LLLLQVRFEGNPGESESDNRHTSSFDQSIKLIMHIDMLEGTGKTTIAR